MAVVGDVAIVDAVDAVAVHGEGGARAQAPVVLGGLGNWNKRNIYFATKGNFHRVQMKSHASRAPGNVRTAIPSPFATSILLITVYLVINAYSGMAQSA